MALNLKNYDPALMQGAEISISSADVSIDDLTVADDATITGDLAVTGTTALTGLVNANAAGIRTFQAVTNVHDTTPTQAEMVTAFGAVPGRGFVGTIGIFGSINSIPRSPDRKHVEAVIAAAGRISRKLGWK